jgi:hypothetical protein
MSHDCWFHGKPLTLHAFPGSTTNNFSIIVYNSSGGEKVTAPRLNEEMMIITLTVNSVISM